MADVRVDSLNIHDRGMVAGEDMRATEITDVGFEHAELCLRRALVVLLKAKREGREVRLTGLRIVRSICRDTSSGLEGAILQMERQAERLNER